MDDSNPTRPPFTKTILYRYNVIVQLTASIKNEKLCTYVLTDTHALMHALIVRYFSLLIKVSAL